MMLSSLISLPEISLRPYQQRIVEDVHEHVKQGKKKILIGLPTGGGKTRIAARIVRDFYAQGLRANFIVNRRELLDQTSSTFSKFGLPHGFISAGKKFSDQEDLYISSIYTMKCREDWKDLSFQVFIFDEADITAWDKCSLDLMNTLYPNAVFIHLTATPYRTKKSESMADVADVAIAHVTPKDLMRMGFLKPSKPYGLSPADIGSVGTSGEDYNELELNVVCNTDELVAKLVEEYERHGLDGANRWRDPSVVGHLPPKQRGRRAICFGTGVGHCKAIAKAFNEAGIPAGVILGTISTAERKEIYRKLATREIVVVVARDVLTAGFDFPAVSLGLFARPTKAARVWFQQYGRILRIWDGTFPQWPDIPHEIPDKEAIALDQAANLQRFDTPESLSREAFGLGAEQYVKPKEDREAVQQDPKICPSCSAVNGPRSVLCYICGAELFSTTKEEVDDSVHQKQKLEEWQGHQWINRPSKIKNLDPVHRAKIHDLIAASRVRGEGKKWVADHFLHLNPDAPVESLEYLAERLDYKPGWGHVRYKQIQKYSTKSLANKREIWGRAIAKCSTGLQVILESKCSLGSLNVPHNGSAIATVNYVDACYEQILLARVGEIEGAVAAIAQKPVKIAFKLL